MASSSVGMANPASLYCLNHGGKLEIREGKEKTGQYGICVFPDGSECEEWAYMEGKCKPSGGLAEVAELADVDKFAKLAKLNQEIEDLENRYYLRKAILENRRKRELKEKAENELKAAMKTYYDEYDEYDDIYEWSAYGEHGVTHTLDEAHRQMDLAGKRWRAKPDWYPGAKSFFHIKKNGETISIT